MRASKKVKREATDMFNQCLVDGSLKEERVALMAQQMTGTRPRGYLDVLSFFLKLVRLHCASRTAKVESAVVLPEELQARLRAALERVYGPGLTMSFVENRTLIGGARIQIGSDVYDGSVKGRLGALERRCLTAV